MLISLILPIVLSSVALFFASFLSWMVLQLHKKDWKKLGNEDEFMDKVGKLDIAPGSYMFPGCESPEEMKSEGFKAKAAAGPNGVITIFPDMKMGKQLALTYVYFLVMSFCIAYLATIALVPGEEFMKVFRFVATAGLMTFLPAIVAHSIWFANRIVGHIIESVVYAVIVGSIFAAMWPQ